MTSRVIALISLSDIGEELKNLATVDFTALKYFNHF